MSCDAIPLRLHLPSFRTLVRVRSFLIVSEFVKTYSGELEWWTVSISDCDKEVFQRCS